jgi:hypothetical protein
VRLSRLKKLETVYLLARQHMDHLEDQLAIGDTWRAVATPASLRAHWGTYSVLRSSLWPLLRGRG